MTSLIDSEITSRMANLPGWNVQDSSQDASASKKLEKEFSFKDFANAMAFANKIAAIAEEEGHHPDLLVAWGKVRVELTTHDVGGLSEKDFVEAARIDAIS